MVHKVCDRTNGEKVGRDSPSGPGSHQAACSLIERKRTSAERGELQKESAIPGRLIVCPSVNSGGIPGAGTKFPLILFAP